MEAPSDQDHAQVLRELGGGSDKENANDDGSDKENASDFVVRPIKPVLPIRQDDQGDQDDELDDDFFPQFDGAASPELGGGETEGEDENGAELEDPPRYASPPPSQTKRKREPGADHRDTFAANHTDDEREPKRRVSPGPQYDEPRRHFVDGSYSATKWIIPSCSSLSQRGAASQLKSSQVMRLRLRLLQSPSV
jgi:hypothetical protein